MDFYMSKKREDVRSILHYCTIQEVRRTRTKDEIQSERLKAREEKTRRQEERKKEQQKAKEERKRQDMDRKLRNEQIIREEREKKLKIIKEKQEEHKKLVTFKKQQKTKENIRKEQDRKEEEERRKREMQKQRERQLWEITLKEHHRQQFEIKLRNNKAKFEEISKKPTAVRGTGRAEEKNTAKVLRPNKSKTDDIKEEHEQRSQDNNKKENLMSYEESMRSLKKALLYLHSTALYTIPEENYED